MRRGGWAILMVGVGVAVAVLPIPLTSAPATADGAPGRESTQQILDRLGGQPCPGGSEFTCVTLAMPLDHFTPTDPRTVDVVFAVLPATGNRKGSFVTATGGPGYSGISVADYYTSGFQAALPQHFDLVFFDQRGLALSWGLTCPQAAGTWRCSARSCRTTGCGCTGSPTGPSCPRPTPPRTRTAWPG